MGTEIPSRPLPTHQSLLPSRPSPPSPNPCFTSTESNPGMRSPSSEFGSGAATDCELRPGGMLVQKREEEAGSEGAMIKIRVSHGSNQHEVAVPAKSTFGELKEILARETGLGPKEQRLLFRGKEKDNEEYLHMTGVKDMSKIALFEDPSSKERKIEQMKKDPEIIKKDPEITKACEAISTVSTEVDKLCERVSALQAAVYGGTKLADKEFDISTELLMTQLLKLDGIKAEGEAKMQRKNEVRRIQSVVDTLDSLKARNSNPFISNSDAVAVSTQWETFDSGMGSLTAPRPMPPSATAMTDDWERFD